MTAQNTFRRESNGTDVPHSPRTDLKIGLIAAFGAAMAIVLHAVVGSFVVTASELEFSTLEQRFGPEIVASVWALFAFSVVAVVFYWFQVGTPGVGWMNGLRFGSAVGLMWLVGMLEGVSLFGNPILNEFLIGLSDAIPVLVMCLLLGKFVAARTTGEFEYQATSGRWVLAIMIIASVYTGGRYIAYLTGVIGSGTQSFPLETFLWTLGMGISIGVAWVLVGHRLISASPLRTAVVFGVCIFGFTWFAFLIFIPLLFAGTLLDILTRIALDIVLVTLAVYGITTLGLSTEKSAQPDSTK
jgi:hypothetical protein